MNNKKIITLSLLTLFVFSFMIGFVQARQSSLEGCNTGFIAMLNGETCAKGLRCDTLQPQDNYTGTCVLRGDIINETKIQEGVEGVLDASKSDKPHFLDRILVFVLVFVVLFGVFSSINIFGNGKSKTFINLLISGILGVIGIRYLSNEFILSLASPTTALTALIFAGLPFLAVYGINKKILATDGTQGPKVAKGIWAAYAVFLIAMNLVNITKQATNPTVQIVSLVFIILAIIMFFLAGKAFARKVIKEVDGFQTAHRSSSIRKSLNTLGEMDEYLKNLNSQLAETTVTSEVADINVKIEQTKKQIKALKKIVGTTAKDK